jgi:hypothetical protein
MGTKHRPHQEVTSHHYAALVQSVGSIGTFGALALTIRQLRAESHRYRLDRLQPIIVKARNAIEPIKLLAERQGYFWDAVSDSYPSLSFWQSVIDDLLDLGLVGDEVIDNLTTLSDLSFRYSAAARMEAMARHDLKEIGGPGTRDLEDPYLVDAQEGWTRAKQDRQTLQPQVVSACKDAAKALNASVRARRFRRRSHGRSRTPGNRSGYDVTPGPVDTA